MCILVPHNGSIFSKFLHLVNYLLESDVESESDGSVAMLFRSAVDLWKVKRIPYKRGINGYSPRIKYRFRHMISSISSSSTHKNPELAAFHKPNNHCLSILQPTTNQAWLPKAQRAISQLRFNRFWRISPLRTRSQLLHSSRSFPLSCA
jgi:hypothetical protein